MKIYILFLLILSPAFVHARMGSETVAATNRVVRGLSFTVSYTQQGDQLQFDIEVTQTDGGTDTIGKMEGCISLGRKLFVQTITRLVDDILIMRFFVAPEELRNTKVTLIAPPQNSEGLRCCVYYIDIESFVKKPDSEPTSGDDSSPRSNAEFKPHFNEFEAVLGGLRDAVVSNKLKTIVLPEVSIQRLSIADTIALLMTESKTHDPDKEGVLILGPAQPTPKDPPITLHMRNVYLGDLIEYCAQLAGLSANVKGGAVVLQYKSQSTIDK